MNVTSRLMGVVSLIVDWRMLPCSAFNASMSAPSGATVSGACGLVAIYYVVSDSSLPPKVMMPACKKEMVCMFSSSFS